MCGRLIYINEVIRYNPIHFNLQVQQELNIITVMNLGFRAWLLDFISFKQAYLINWQHWNQYLISEFYWLNKSKSISGGCIELPAVSGRRRLRQGEVFRAHSGKINQREAFQGKTNDICLPV